MHVNPAIQSANQNTAAPLSDMMKTFQSMKDPMAWLQMMCASNPRLQPLAQCLKESGGDPKAAFYKMAEQQGVNPDDIINTAKQYMK